MYHSNKDYLYSLSKERIFLENIFRNYADKRDLRLPRGRTISSIGIDQLYWIVEKYVICSINENLTTDSKTYSPCEHLKSQGDTLIENGCLLISKNAYYDKDNQAYYMKNYIKKINHYNQEYDKEDIYLSKQILALKEGSFDSIYLFLDFLDGFIVDGNISVAMVPPHDPKKHRTSGLSVLISMLCMRKSLRNITNQLTRSHYIESSHRCGNRSYKDRYDSLIVTDKNAIENKNILLVDDVITTGNSIRATRDFLYEAGAKHVTSFCFLKTLFNQY